MFNNYNDGIEQLIELLDQDVHKTKDKVVKGYCTQKNKIKEKKSKCRK